jgi:DNA-nicking Smr family endonuclease
MKSKRPLAKSELALWRAATADVRPLVDQPAKTAAPAQSPKAKPPEVAAPAKTAHAPKLPKDKPPPPPPRGARPLDPTRPVDIDRRSWARLKRGQVEIERTLDLHGRTQTEAHGALNRFLTMAHAAGLRCVLVVTGKGGGEGRGVLRQMVPRWLGEPTHRSYVLTFCPAQPRHGGNGALYVLLKRRRDGRG